jgi:hypothetical protein
MSSGTFRIHDGLFGGTRLPFVVRTNERISAAELAVLLMAGSAAAAATGLISMGLRIPGSSIVLAILPIAFGFSVVPRRLSGLVMSGSALGTAGALTAVGVAHYGVGALTSLCLTGAMMDAALIGAKPGWRLYVRFVGAGVASNLIAFVQRGGSKLFALDQPGTRVFAEWLPQALVTYVLSGAVAGLIGAGCWFAFRAASRPAAADPGQHAA